MLAIGIIYGSLLLVIVGLVWAKRNDQAHYEAELQQWKDFEHEVTVERIARGKRWAEQDLIRLQDGELPQGLPRGVDWMTSQSYRSHMAAHGETGVPIELPDVSQIIGARYG